MTLEVEPDLVPCDIYKFYLVVARAAGFEVTDKSRFNCSRLHVTEKIQNDIFEYYRSIKAYSDEDIAELWLWYGPKADIKEAKNPYTVVIDKGFLVGD